jgi:hypothetical protein
VLHRGEVRLPKIMHVKADLMDNIGDVRTGERQVLEGPGKAPEVSRISNRRPGGGGDLDLHVHGRRDWLTFHHASALKDVESELVLSEEESIGLMLYGDPQKVVKRSDVLHGELPLEGRYGVLQERCAKCNEHNVTNIKQQVYCIGAVAVDEQGGVRLSLNKSQGAEVRGEPAVPSPGCLLQPVERLVEAIDPVRLRGINKPHRLTAVDCLRESTMQQCVLHIKLVDGLGTGVG